MSNTGRPEDTVISEQGMDLSPSSMRRRFKKSAPLPQTQMMGLIQAAKSEEAARASRASLRSSRTTTSSDERVLPTQTESDLESDRDGTYEKVIIPPFQVRDKVAKLLGTNLLSGFLSFLQRARHSTTEPTRNPERCMIRIV